MDWKSLAERVQEMFPNQRKSDIEQFIESKNPKTESDVEHWLQEYTHNNQKNWLPNA